MENRTGERSYIEGALRLLQFVEARRPTGRRFGPEADARWGGFKGDLDTVDRIELLIRDADAEWPGALGARTVYALRAVAEDEPFGAGWQGLDSVEALDLWRRLRAEAPPATPAATLRAIGSSWGLSFTACPLPPVAATDHLVVTGPSALVAAVDAFAQATDLDWAEQVSVIATPPAHRQLAAAAAALLNTPRPTRLFSSTETTASPRGARLVASGDAAPADRAAAEGLVGG